jgi:hypothetical protein
MQVSSGKTSTQPFHKFSFAFLLCVSVCSRHAAIAETAARPSQGSRSRNVIIIVALSWSFMGFDLCLCVHTGNAQDPARGYAKSLLRQLETLEAFKY